MPSSQQEPLYDWNREDRGRDGVRPLTFDDETLRDGLQSPSVATPGIEDRVQFLSLAARVGIGFADIGMPGAGEQAAAEVEAIFRAMTEAGLPLRANCAARTVDSDIRPILDIAQRVGQELEVALFVAPTPLRRGLEGWTVEELLRRTESCVRLAVDHGAAVTFVTEDTTRSHPDDLGRLVQCAVRSGAARVCIADTAGHATPMSVMRIVRWLRRVLEGLGVRGTGIDWHGHNDRGLAVANALTAAWAGADRLHGTALGLGERVGNAAMEQLLVNASLAGWASADLRELTAYVEHASRMLGVLVPVNAPIVGRDAFRTATGVHAAAILKARRSADPSLADIVYSAVPAPLVGRFQEVEVGPMSGASNVRLWLAAHGYTADEAIVTRILAAAKRSRTVLSEQRLQALAEDAEPAG